MRCACDVGIKSFKIEKKKNRIRNVYTYVQHDAWKYVYRSGIRRTSSIVSKRKIYIVPYRKREEKKSNVNSICRQSFVLLFYVISFALKLISENHLTCTIDIFGASKFGWNKVYESSCYELNSLPEWERFCSIDLIH